MRLSASLLALCAAGSIALAQPQALPHARLPFSAAKNFTSKKTAFSSPFSLAKTDAATPNLVAASAPTREWINTFNNSAADSDDVAYEVTLDASGNVYVIGFSFNLAGNSDIFTVKYNNVGVRQWVARYNGPAKGDDIGYGLAVDANGNVYVAGASINASGNDDAVTLKYNSAGVLQWAKRYDGVGLGDDVAFDLQLDHAGNVHIGGYTQINNTEFDLLTIKYDPAGTQQWSASFHGFGSDNATIYELAVDAAQNVYVAGYSSGATGSLDYTTIKYNSTGAEQWAAFYNSPADSTDFATGLAVDHLGNSYVTGASINANGNFDYVTLKYDSLGVRQWTARHDSKSQDNDQAFDIALDAWGNAHVTGGSVRTGAGVDFATIKYNNAGQKQWVAVYGGAANGDDVAQRVLVDLAGNVYVAGYSMSASSLFDYLIVGYDSSATQQWSVRHNGGGNSDDYANDIALDHLRNIYVTGAVKNTNGNYDIGTLKYATLSQSSCAPSAQLFAVEAQGPSGTQVYRYDVRPSGAPSLTLALTHPNFDSPSGLAFSDEKELFAGNRSSIGTGSVSRFLDALNTPLFNGAIMPVPATALHGLAFHDGELFIAENVGGRILRYRFGITGEALAHGEIISGASYGLVFSPWGELFVSTGSGNTILRYIFDVDGNASANGTITGNGLGNPLDLAFSPWGELFVTNLDSNSVSRFTFDPAHNASANGVITGAALNGPAGLSFSPWNELFVGNFLGAGGVARWKFDGAFVATANGAFATPTTLGDIEFLPNEKILLVNAGSDKQVACTDSVQLGGNPSVIVGTAPLSYLWTPSTGLNNPNAANPMASPSANTTYILKVTDAHGCIARDTVVINVTALANGWSVQHITDVDDVIMGMDQGQAQNPAPRDVEALTLSANERYLYLSYHLTHDKRVVRKIDLEVSDPANNHAGVVAQLQFPNGTVPINALAADDRGRVYISFETEIRIYDANLATLLYTIPGFTDCEGITTRRENGKMYVYATDRSDKTLERFELTEGAGEAVSAATKAGLDGDGEILIPTSTSPRGVAIQSNGLVWVADNGTNSVIRLYANGTFRGTTSVPKAHDLAIDASRNEVFVSQYTLRTIKVLNVWNGQVKRTLTPPAASLNIDLDGDLGDGALAGLDVASCKRVFVANRRGRSVLAGNPSDSPFSNIGDNNNLNAADADPILVVTGNVLSKEEGEATGGEIAAETIHNYALEQNYPNPFNPETKISFALPRAGEVKLSIFSETGQLVRTLVNRAMQPGRHELRWNGRNQQGIAVAAGVYLYRVTVTGESGEIVFSQTNRMTLLK